MNFSQAISSCLSQYATFSGRASRSEFWWFFLFQALALFIVANLNEKIVTVVILALLVPSLAVGARRLHDMGKSGWWQLLTITSVGCFFLIYWWAQPTDNSLAL